MEQQDLSEDLLKALGSGHPHWQMLPHGLTEGIAGLGEQSLPLVSASNNEAAKEHPPQIDLYTFFFLFQELILPMGVFQNLQCSLIT